jgi:hypothetical protein
MILISSLRTHLRSFLTVKEYLQRRLPRKSGKPRIGSHVVNVQENLRIIVQAGMSDELWKWLMDRGWRVETYRPDRRQYRDIPALWATALIDAEPVFREKVMADAVESTQARTRWCEGRIDGDMSEQ